MISDETFPSDHFLSDIEFEDEEIIKTKKRIKMNGQINDNSSTEEDLSSSLEIEHSNSMETDRLLETTDFQNTTQSFKFNDIEMQLTHREELFQTSSSQNLNILPASRAPIKKKRSFSCQNLNVKKNKNGHNNYDHVESKVKQLIENLAEDRRKTLLRHKSMPVCVTQTPVIDEKPQSDMDINDLKRELRRKSIKIYELEEKCEMKDNQIYELEKEKSKMKMIFDTLRVEIQQLREVERRFAYFKSQYSPNKTQRNVLIQTEDSGIEHEHSKRDIIRESVMITHNNATNRVLMNPVLRQLAFENSNLNQTQFSEDNNTSSDNLIPDAELLLENFDIQADKAVEEKNQNGDGLKVKKKKTFKFFRFVPCVQYK